MPRVGRGRDGAKQPRQRPGKRAVSFALRSRNGRVTRRVWSAEELAELVHEGLLLGLHVFAELERQGLDQLSLLARQLARDLDGHLRELIAATDARALRD